MLIYSLADSLKICFIQNLCHNKKTRYQCAHCACMPYIIRKLCSQQMITFSLLIITLPQCYCIRKTLATIISSKNVGINKPKYLPSLFWTVQKWNFMNFNKRQKKYYFRKKIVFSYHQIQCFQIQLEIKATDLEKQNHAMNLSPGFCVRRPRQYNTICRELNLISGFFAFLWLFLWGGWNQ